MDFLALAKQRCSVRKYTNQPVSDELLQRVVEAARVAPSAVNFQPWHFVVVRKQPMLDAVKACYHRDWINQAPAIVVCCAVYDKGWKRSADGKDHTDIDVAIAIDHMTLAATSIGLGTCWVCNFDVEKCVALFEWPEHIRPVALLPIGYTEARCDESRHDVQRKKMDEIVSWK